MKESEVKASARQVRLLICDVDGVLTRGEIYLDNTELELKAFNIKDGLGIKLLQQSGIEIAIITGRKSHIVQRRMAELGITHCYQGQKNKIKAYDKLLETLDITQAQVAYIGDDLPDLPLMRRSGLGIAVADAHFSVKERADWITFNEGGYGAVRDAVDLILDAKGLLEDIHEGFWQQ